MAPTRRNLLAATAGLSALGGCLDGTTDTTDDGSPAGTGGFDISQEGNYELPTDPDSTDFVDRSGQAVVAIETSWRKNRTPEFVFDPPFVRVDAGTTVHWVNSHDVYHSVTATDSLESRTPSGEFDTQLPAAGASFEWEATDPGRQHYYCTPHAGFMFGTLDVA